MMNWVLGFAVGSLLGAGCFTGPADAEDLPAGSFKCVKLSDFADQDAGTTWVKINNFSIKEGKSFLAPQLSSLDISFSLANRAAVAVHVTAQFVVMNKDGKPLAAVSAGSPFSMVAAGSTETADGSTYVASGTLKGAEQICYAVVGDMPK